MEEHLNDKNRLSKEWEDLCNYEAEPNETIVASKEENMNKNRYSNILPCKNFFNIKNITEKIDNFFLIILIFK